jgi:hypothetical protein
MAAIGAADDPIEFGREGSRSTGKPFRFDCSANGEDQWVVVPTTEVLQPGGVGHSVVIEEGNDIAGSGCNTRVTRP